MLHLRGSRSPRSEFIHQTAEAKHGSNQRKQRTNEMHPTPSRHERLNLIQRRHCRFDFDLLLQTKQSAIRRRHDDQSERDHAHSHHACRRVSDPPVAGSPLGRHRVRVDEERGNGDRRHEQVAVMVQTDPLRQHVGGLGVGVEEERDRRQREAHHGACEGRGGQFGLSLVIEDPLQDMAYLTGMNL